jgi:hypothetical protein
MTRKSNIILRIGAILYNLGWKHRPHYEGKFCVGLVDYFDQTIDTYVGLAPSMEWVNVWHEMVHAILKNAGYEDHDEEMVSALAHGICQILIDNPIVHQPIPLSQRQEPEDEVTQISLEQELASNDTRSNKNTLDS